MRVLITGSEGFVGKNLRAQLTEQGHADILCWTRSTTANAVGAALAEADLIFHLAGTNRPRDPAEFATGNRDLTRTLCDALLKRRRPPAIVYASSTQAAYDNPYGRSKAAAEEVLLAYAAATGALVRNLRLHNIFGKWCRPNYNSVVATYCHNITRGLPIRIDDGQAPLSLVYIDDVVAALAAYLRSPSAGDALYESMPVYASSVGALAAELYAFKESRQTLRLGPVGCGFLRALYATYVSYLPADAFSYPIPKYTDPRGSFSEMLKTRDSGQFSFFTAHPGATRGGHYHHSKTEKFLVIRGRALFRFRHIVTGECLELNTDGDSPRVVETVPGWAHDITNIGDEEMVVMLWANEVFDRERPDTYAKSVQA